MWKRYEQYCPVAHALDLVGEQWALLVVRELMRARYEADAAGSQPPRGSMKSPSTDARCRRSSASWRCGGPPSLGPPTADDELFSGWLENALNTVLAPIAPPGRFELRIGDEVASLVDGEAQPGPVEQPDVVVEGEPEGVYRMFGDRRLDLVSVQGDRRLLEQLIAVVPALSRRRFPRSRAARSPAPRGCLSALGPRPPRECPRAAIVER